MTLTLTAVPTHTVTVTIQPKLAKLAVTKLANTTKHLPVPELKWYTTKVPVTHRLIQVRMHKLQIPTLIQYQIVWRNYRFQTLDDNPEL